MKDETHTFIPVLAGILVNSRGEIFIARRKAHLKHGGKWEFPGGKLNANEQPPDCLQRELQEEFGVAATVNAIFDVATHTMGNITIVLIAYWARFEKEPVASTDHDQFQWVAPEALLTFDLTPADVVLAHKLQSVSLPTSN